MASVINTNMMSLSTQRNLASSQSSLSTSIERLSSGLRINNSSDDAAGQAIANRFTSQINGLNIAMRNANDGISMAQTTEGALNQVNDNLQRVRELTVQSQNGTLSQSDRDSINLEINQRMEEIDRISAETSFNGVKVLASNQKVEIQVGAQDGEKISFDTKQLDVANLNLTDFNPASTALNKGADLDGEAIGAVTVSSGTLADAVATLNATTQYSGVTTDDVTVREVLAADGSGASTGTYIIEYDDKSFLADVNSSTGSGINIVTVSGSTDDLVQVGRDNAGTGYVTFRETQAGATESGAAIAADTTTGATTAPTDGSFTGTYTGSDPLADLDAALKQVDSLRSELGAAQNRYKSAISNLGATSNNLSAARSRIEDADYAAEVSSLTRAQILQQAGTSVLAQANQAPQGVLGLL